MTELNRVADANAIWAETRTAPLREDMEELNRVNDMKEG
jgi:hypothetical protein